VLLLLPLLLSLNNNPRKVDQKHVTGAVVDHPGHELQLSFAYMLRFPHEIRSRNKVEVLAVSFEF
jgi:hypothetical protein